MPPDTPNPSALTSTPVPEPNPPNDESSPFAARGNGKIARLPKTARDQINHWLLDGLSYPQIIQRLGEQGKDLKPGHLCEWKKRGYQDWLTEQSFIARTRARQETPADLIHDFDGTGVNQAALQLGTLYIFEALRDLGPGALDDKLGGDCAAFARLLNALARASRETLQLQKYRDACARARAELQQLKDPHRELNESETRAIVRKVDAILGLRSEPDAPATP